MPTARKTGFLAPVRNDVPFRSIYGILDADRLIEDTKILIQPKKVEEDA